MDYYRGNRLVLINREPLGDNGDYSYAGILDNPQVCYVGADARQSGTFQGEMVAELDNHGDINGDGKVSYEKDGKTVEVPANVVLVSTGRRARTAGIGLEAVGVLTERGAVVTDECGRTSVPGIYAAGDVNGKSMLAHTAYRESEVAVNHILGIKDKMRYNAIPSVIYTTPEVGSVGETEDSAKEKGLDFRVSTISMKFSGRFVAENEGGDGIVKIIVGEHREIVGVHMIGSYASEIIMTATMMVDTEMNPERLKKLVFPHPTVAEMIREAIFHI